MNTKIILWGTLFLSIACEPDYLESVHIQRWYEGGGSAPAGFRDAKDFYTHDLLFCNPTIEVTPETTYTSVYEWIYRPSDVNNASHTIIDETTDRLDLTKEGLIYTKNSEIHSLSAEKDDKIKCSLTIAYNQTNTDTAGNSTTVELTEEEESSYVTLLKIENEETDTEDTENTEDDELVNNPPVIDSLNIIWSSDGEAPLSTDNLTCQATGSDPDEDELSFFFVWTEQTSDTSVNGLSLLSTETEAGESWTCTVAVSDGEETVTAASEPITIVAE